MTDTLSDAEIVRRLQTMDEVGSLTAASSKLGLTRSAMQNTVAAAKVRGLTGKSVIKDDAAKWKTQAQNLQRQLTQQRNEADSAEAIREAIYGLSARSPEPPQWVLREGKVGSRGAPLTIFSDWHWGEVVLKEEVAGVNEFNEKIGRARVKRLVDTTIDLCFNHMGRSAVKYPGLIVCLGGDMITGDIHEELRATNDRTPQQSVNDLTDIIAASLDNLAAKFGRLFVPCVVGNHGRSTLKPRMKGRVYTSYEWNIYCNLERHFRSSKNVQFLIPGEADAHFSVFGHRYLLTHGDSLGVKGGDGIIGALGPIMRGALKVGRSEAQIGRDFDTLLIGHWHQFQTPAGVICNGSLIGYNEYARLALRARFEPPTQALIFTHPEWGITARWPMYLEPPLHKDAEKAWIKWT